MKRVKGEELAEIRSYFKEAAKLAKKATCYNARCGTVIVSSGQIIGEGYNGPAFDDETNRTCNQSHNLSIKPNYDKTCCTHAEWRAIIDACKQNPDKISEATLYFMRINQTGEFTDAGEPYCTTCSRLALESGIKKFALWNRNGADIYDTAEYNKKSYQYYITE